MSEVAETKFENTTLRSCLENCLETQCYSVIFCNGACWFATKDALDEANNEVQLNQNAVSSALPIMSYCVMYEYFPPTSTSPYTFTVPLNQIVYRQEEETSAGTCQFNNWKSGTTLQFQIPSGTEGSITFMQEKDHDCDPLRKLILNTNPTSADNVEDGKIEIGSSGGPIVRLRKPLHVEEVQVRVNGVLKGTLNDNFNDVYLITIATSNPVKILWSGEEACGETLYPLNDTSKPVTVTIYAIPENTAICLDGKKAATEFSVSVYNLQKGYQAQVKYVPKEKKAYITEASEYEQKLFSTKKKLKWSEGTNTDINIEQTSELIVEMIVNQAAQKVNGTINDISLKSVNPSFQFTDIYVSGGLTITDIFFK